MSVWEEVGTVVAMLASYVAFLKLPDGTASDRQGLTRTFQAGVLIMLALIVMSLDAIARNQRDIIAAHDGAANVTDLSRYDGLDGRF